METNAKSEKEEQASGTPRSSKPEDSAKPEEKKRKPQKHENKHQKNETVADWDVAVETPPISADDSDTWVVLTKIAVAILNVFLFLIVFVSTGLTRVVIHLMIWKLNPPSRNSPVTLNKLGGLLQIVEERATMHCVSNCSVLNTERSQIPSSWRCEPINNTSYCQLEEDIPTVNVWWIWGLIIAIIVPDIYSLILSSWRWCFKETEPFDMRMLILSIIVETVHTIGLCLLVFLVLPAFDPITASVLSFLIVFFPGFLSFFSKFKFSSKNVENIKRNSAKVTNSSTETESKTTKTENNSISHNIVHNVLPICGLLLLIGSIALISHYIYINQNSDDERATSITTFLFSLIFVSVIYWENFLIFPPMKSAGDNGTANTNTDTTSNISKLKGFLMLYIRSRREKVSLITTIWKVALTIAFPFLAFSLRSSDDGGLKVVKALAFHGSAKMKTLTGEVMLESQTYSSFGCHSNDIELLVVTCVLLGFVSFKSARFACRVYLQIWCFSLPLTLSLLGTPLVFIAILRYPLSWTVQQCSVVQPLWELTGTSVEEIWQVIVVGILGFLSCFFITLYIWTNDGSKLLKCDRLFRKPPYCGIFLDLSLMLTRCKDTSEQTTEEIDQGADSINPKCLDKTNSYYTPFVYFCATMWHETETEMTQLLKSIFRVDYDQHLQLEHERNIQKKYKNGYYNEDVYEFEVHIFFDDAFKARIGKNGKPLKSIRENDYVKTLEKVIVATAKSVYGGFELDKPSKFETPYGARFEWDLLTDKAKLVVHLKDKKKIRNRKRWSQVMYLYYLLSFKMREVKDKIMQEKKDGRGKEEDKNNTDKKNAEGMDDLQNKMMKFSANTFILALDGDVDFKPEAVTLLLDRMKKNPLVGAACGRIHPIGAGPMVWYQKFEYAISHWLQKATEHVFGCVLCSPGCFSLFRGSALLADNVMKTYTRTPTEAAHYVQYDQGEDRWLCTLLLKQRFRVEYCAASDALTFAPEGFYEFYKQRRRWAPSTMANILDLLMDGNTVRKNNQNISRPYIFYHLCLFISSILTPGTIFLLIMGAILTAFPAIQPWLALLLNGLPVAIFIISIFLAKEDTQLLLAAIFSTIYSLVMLVVLIGLLKEGIESQFCSVTTVFFCFVAGVFLLAAILHPMELSCILHGVLYFLAVPSMSMLLIFYSVGNMHNVNWGTRENKSQKADDSSNSVQKRFLGQTCSIGDWCRCILCVTEKDVEPVLPRENETDEDQPEVETSEHNEKPKKQSKQKQNLNDGAKKALDKDTAAAENDSKTKKVEEKTKPEDNSEAGSKSKNKSKQNPSRKKDQPGKKLGMFKECTALDEEEMEFWKSFIKKYLEPEKNIAESKKEIMQAELIDLRNKVFFFYFIINAIFVTVVYVLTQVNSQQNTLSIPLPCSVGETQGKIEPISIAFTLVFGILLLIQFFGMLMHRISTISHIMASTKIFGRKLDTKVPMQKIKKPVTLQDEEPIVKAADVKISARQRWRRTGIALKLLSGEQRQKPKTLVDLKKSISSQLETIKENPEENKDILELYSNEPISRASIRNPVSILRRKGEDTIPGPSSA